MNLFNKLSPKKDHVGGGAEPVYFVNLGIPTLTFGVSSSSSLCSPIPNNICSVLQKMAN